MRIVGALGVVLAGLSVIGAVTAYGQIDARSQYGGTTATVVDDKGNLRVPADYRTAYQMLGSWAVAKDDGPGSKEMHVVYASPGTIAAYRKDGHFPDRTVLVKEVFKTTTKDMTIGTVSSAGTLAGPRPLTLDVERAFHETNDRGELSQVAEAVRSFLDERCVSKGDSYGSR